MIRRPPRSTQSRSSAASDVYKRQVFTRIRESSLGRRRHCVRNVLGNILGNVLRFVGGSLEESRRLWRLDRCCSLNDRSRSGNVRLRLGSEAFLGLRNSNGSEDNGDAEHHQSEKQSVHCSIHRDAFPDFESHAASHRGRRFASDNACLLYTSPSPRDLSTSRMPSSA